MAKTFTAPFAQSPKTTTAVATDAVGSLTGDNPTNTVLLATAGSDGAILTKLTAIPRDTVTASGLTVFLSKDSGTTKRLIDSQLMDPYTSAATTATPVTAFEYSETLPLRLEAGDQIYVGTQVTNASGIVFKCELTDF